VDSIVKSIFEERLKNEQFDPHNSQNIVEELTKLIRYRVKTELNIPRYKLAIQVVLGSMEGQAVKVASKCLWDPKFDNYASVSYKNESLYCVGMVFGCYHE
jgi:tctex1 domain-containing protein 2